MTAQPPTPEEQLRDLARRGRRRELARRALVWSVAVGLLVYLGATTDLAEVWRSVLSVNPLLLLLATVGFGVAAFVLDAWSLVVLFRRRAVGLGFRELAPIRGESFLLNVINYNAAVAAIALFLRRRAGIPLMVSASSLLLLNVVDLMALNVLVTCGVALDPGLMGAEMRHTLILANLGLYALLGGALLYWVGGFDFLVLGRLRRLAIFAAFREARLRELGVLLLWRLALMTVYTVQIFVVMRLFHIPVPLHVVLAVNPVVGLIGTLPISVSGIGTTQVAMRELYGAFGTVARIDAFSTTQIFVQQLMRLLIAWFYMARGGKRAPGEALAGSAPPGVGDDQ